MPEFSSKYVQVHIATYDSNRDDYSYLVMQRSDDIEVYPSLWQVITGTINPDETALEAAIREVWEETGIKTDKIWTLPYIAQFYNPKSDLIHLSPVFGIIIDSTQDVRLSDEHQKYEWLKFYDCIDRLVLPAHKDGTRIFWEYVISQTEKEMFSMNI